MVKLEQLINQLEDAKSVIIDALRDPSNNIDSLSNWAEKLLVIQSIIDQSCSELEDLSSNDNEWGSSDDADFSDDGWGYTEDDWWS